MLDQFSDTTVFCVPHTVRKEYLAPSPLGPFVSNDAYANITEYIRDLKYAPTQISNFAHDIGQSYLLWTRGADYRYHKTCYTGPGQEIFVSLMLSREQPRRSTFELQIVIHDGTFEGRGVHDGVYATCTQEIACQKLVPVGEPPGMKAVTTGWGKIPTIRDFVEARK